LATDTIKSIVGCKLTGVAPLFGTMMTVIKDFATGAQDLQILNNLVPTRLILYRMDKNTGFDNTKMIGELFFAHERCHFVADSTIRMQNRTQANDATNDANDVGANPVVGMKYDIGMGCPVARISGISLLESLSDYTGVMTLRAAQVYGTVTSLRQPPPAQTFLKCKAVKVKLQPGEIRSSTVRYKESKNFFEFFKTLGFGNDPNGKQTHLRGNFQMFGLEHCINVNVANNVIVAYMVNRHLGAYWTTHSDHIALGAYDSLGQNNP